MILLSLLSIVSSIALADTLDAKKADWSTASVLAEAADPIYAADGVLVGSVVGAVQDSDGDTLSITWTVDVADADKASQAAQAAVKGASSHPTVDAFLHDATRAEPSVGDTVYGIVSDGTNDNIVVACVSARDEIENVAQVSVADAAVVNTRVVWSDDGVVTTKTPWAQIGATVRVEDGLTSIVSGILDGGADTGVPGAGWGWDNPGGLSDEDTGWFDDALGGTALKELPDFANFVEHNGGGEGVYTDTNYGDFSYESVMDALEGRDSSDTSSQTEYAIFMAIHDINFDLIDQKNEMEAAGQTVPDDLERQIQDNLELMQQMAEAEAEEAAAEEETSTDGSTEEDEEEETDAESESTAGDPDFEEDVDAETMNRFLAVASFIGVDPFNTHVLGEKLGFRSDDDGGEDVDAAFVETRWLEFGCVTSADLCLTDDDEDAVYAELVLMDMLCESGLCVGAGSGGPLSKSGLANLNDGGVSLNPDVMFNVVSVGD